jgi:putative ABC transport system permease protein
VGPANFADWKTQSRAFQAMAAYANWNYNLSGGDDPRRLQTILVTGEFFQTLGVEAELGRVLLPDDDQEGKDNVVVLSHSFWKSRFGASRDSIGQTVVLNGRPHTIVGVMPPSFSFPDESVDIWRPLGLSLEQSRNREGKWLKVVARVQSGASIGQARSELATIAKRLEIQYPATNSGWGVGIEPLRDEIVGPARRVLLVVTGAVAFVLVIACANLANLMLARVTTRHKEMALRAALGASRGRIAAQLLIESLLLAALGGVLGLLLALWSKDTLVALSPATIPRLSEATIDGPVLGFTLAVSFLTALIFGVIPAWQASRADLNLELKGKTHASGMANSRLRRFLIIGEVAVGLVLLVGAGLTIKSFLRLQKVDPGFDPRHLLTMAITLPSAKYSNVQKQTAFFEQTIERIRNVPGVRAVGAVQDLPFRFNEMSFPVMVEGRTSIPVAQRPKAAYRTVTQDYFRTLGIQLVRGRLFDSQDSQEATPVVIINQAMARSFWPNEDPLGQRVRFGEPDDPAYLVVGVVRDIKHMGLDADEGPVIYQPHAQKRFAWLRWMTLVVRTETEPTSLAETVRARVLEVDKDQPVYNVASVEQLLDKSIAQPRFSMLLLAGFAFLALNLTLLGVYGVVSYTVAQRTREIGVRMAVGAQRRDVLCLVVGDGLRLVVVGVVVGVAAALALTRVIQSLLFEVSATDPATFLVISLLLVGVTLVACYLPANRGAKLNPVEALRYE